MTLESIILECHVTYISYNTYKETKRLKSEIELGADKRFLPVWFSKESGFNLEKKKKHWFFVTCKNLLVNSCILKEDFLIPKLIFS